MKKDNTHKEVIKDLENLADPKKAEILSRFFKTGKGEYGYGDVFLGITVPKSRIIAKKYSLLALKDISKLLNSKIHEHRLVALEILVMQYEKARDKEFKKEIVTFYIKHIPRINNWDLVDLSAQYILGDYFFDKRTNPFKKMTKSKNLWERRIAMISTFGFIYRGESERTLEIAELLLNDKHDLIHKAVGWMLREVGKRVSEGHLIKFLNKHANKMPRTALRYAIERLNPETRKHYLKLSTAIF
jgi:3-methyladenine DNA glycosylase AlkD